MHSEVAEALCVQLGDVIPLCHVFPQNNGGAFMTALHSINPATNEIVWQGLAATSAQVDAAVRDARRAFESWVI